MNFLNMFIFMFLVFIAAGNAFLMVAERVGWFGSPNDPHISHAGITFIYFMVAVIFFRTSRW